jgi:hypothetical protein
MAFHLPPTRIAGRLSTSTRILHPSFRNLQALLPLLRRTYHNGQHQQRRQKSFFGKLRSALKDTKTEWYSIPVGVGAGVIAFAQLRKTTQSNPNNNEAVAEKKIKPMGAW